jgi:preprotein translocase subunit YajC
VAVAAPRPGKWERRAGEAAIVEEGDRVLTEGGLVG